MGREGGGSRRGGERGITRRRIMEPLCEESFTLLQHRDEDSRESADNEEIAKPSTTPHDDRWRWER